MKKWQQILQPILVNKIAEAVDLANDEMGTDVFPWIGGNCYEIMTDAAICVLRGMQDAEDYMENEGMLSG